MSLTKYEILLKTAECGSFTRAAQELNFTQSGISHAVSSLEAELGTTLVVRSHGGVSLTADGRALLPYFREMCALQHQLEHRVRASALQLQQRDRRLGHPRAGGLRLRQSAYGEASGQLAVTAGSVEGDRSL